MRILALCGAGNCGATGDIGGVARLDPPFAICILQGLCKDQCVAPQRRVSRDVKLNLEAAPCFGQYRH